MRSSMRVRWAIVAVAALCTSSALAQQYIRGGRLYDRWWAVTGATPPTTDHPLWEYRPDPVSNPRTGAATWRCKECHGWDYKGVDGQYGSGSHRTGFPGILGTTLPAAEVFTLLREPPNNGGGPGVLNGHDYGSVISDMEINHLVSFVQFGLLDDDSYIDPDSADFFGDPVQGEINYTNGMMMMNCINCHGPDGTWLNFGTPTEPEWVGTVATHNPWEFMHKVRFGQPGTTMPSWLMHGNNQGAADIGRYVQDDFPVDCTDFGDLDADNQIGLPDLAILLTSYGVCVGDPQYDPAADMDDDGCVALNDLSSLLANYGTACP